MTATFYPDAVFVPLPLEDYRAATGQPLVVRGNLHMLNWPDDETEQNALVSRCADDVLPPGRLAEIQQVYAIDAKCRGPDERPPVDWQDIIKHLPRAPVITVLIFDAGDTGWVCSYEKKSRQVSRQQSRILDDGMAKFRLKMH